MMCFICKKLQSGFCCCFLGGPNIWAITLEERTKHDKQFDSLKPTGGYITGWSGILHYTLTAVYTEYLCETV